MLSGKSDLWFCLSVNVNLKFSNFYNVKCKLPSILHYKHVNPNVLFNDEKVKAIIIWMRRQKALICFCQMAWMSTFQIFSVQPIHIPYLISILSAQVIWMEHRVYFLALSTHSFNKWVMARALPPAVLKQAMDIMEVGRENQSTSHKVFISLPFVKWLGHTQFCCFLQPPERSSR